MKTNKNVYLKGLVLAIGVGVVGWMYGALANSQHKQSVSARTEQTLIPSQDWQEHLGLAEMAATNGSLGAAQDHLNVAHNLKPDELIIIDAALGLASRGADDSVARNDHGDAQEWAAWAAQMVRQTGGFVPVTSAMRSMIFLSFNACPIAHRSVCPIQLTKTEFFMHLHISRRCEYYNRNCGIALFCCMRRKEQHTLKALCRKYIHKN